MRWRASLDDSSIINCTQLAVGCGHGHGHGYGQITLVAAFVRALVGAAVMSRERFGLSS